jgi:lantibiotic modifying enzyme
MALESSGNSLLEGETERLLQEVASSIEVLRLPVERFQLEGALRASLSIFIQRETQRLIDLPTTLKQLVALPRFGDVRVDALALQNLGMRRAHQWHTSTLELFSRLEGDLQQIVSRFNIPSEARLVAISPPLGDLHNNGRSVYCLTFSNGSRLIYKPRSIDAEAAFAWIIRHLHDRGWPTELMSHVLLPKQGYGWTEFIQHIPCGTTNAAASFYRRQGAFLFLFWRLCAADAISDNVVVCGEHPVWIDTECILRPELIPRLSNQNKVPQWIQESLLTTGMTLAGENASWPHAGLDACCAHDRSMIYTDTGRLREVYACSVVQGFQESYQWLLSRPNILALHSDVIWRLRQVSVRIILRRTHIYDILLRLIASRYPADSCDLQLVLDEMLRKSDDGIRYDLSSALAVEKGTLLRGDIPHWSIATTSTDAFESSGERVNGFARRSPLETLHRRGLRMTDRDLSQQTWLLQATLAGRRCV